jgi:hypothetical protein
MNTLKIGWIVLLNVIITLAEYIGDALQRGDYLKK